MKRLLVLIIICTQISSGCINSEPKKVPVLVPLAIKQLVVRDGILFCWKLSNNDGIDHIEVAALHYNSHEKFSLINSIVPNTARSCLLSNLLPYTTYSTYLNIHYPHGVVKKRATGTWRTWPIGKE